MNQVIVQSFAKVNLALNVGERTDSGLHELDGVFSSVSLCDYVKVTKRDDRKITVFSTTEIEGKNSAESAAEAYMERFSTKGVDIIIRKSIPIAAGLGGSTADAVGTLLAMETLFGKKASSKLIESLGSDAAFMYKGGLARVCGVGNECEQLPYAPFECLVSVPTFGCSTAETYAQFDNVDGENANVDEVAAHLKKLEVFSAVRSGKNSLENAAYSLNPELRELREKLESAAKELLDETDFCILMTGSGSAHLTFCKTRTALQELQAKFAPICWTVLAKSVEKSPIIRKTT